MERKIMVEVTPEEYEKIVSGGLNKTEISTEDLVKILLSRSTDKQNRMMDDMLSGRRIIITNGSLKINDRSSLEFIYKVKE